MPFSRRSALAGSTGLGLGGKNADSENFGSFVYNPHSETLRGEIAAWSSDVNTRQRGVDWRINVDDDPRKLKSIDPKIMLERGTRLSPTSQACGIAIRARQVGSQRS